jgi:hypothetical protein
MTTLYRHFNATGRLLYVGISDKALMRLTQHRKLTPWWDQIAHITLMHLPDRATAIVAEKLAIQTEDPIYIRYGWGPRGRVKNHPIPAGLVV